MKEIFEKIVEYKKNNAVTAVFLLLAAFLAVQTLAGLMELRFIGSGVPATNTISVEGVGEAVAVPDIATISFTVSFEEDTVASAQSQTTELISSVLAHLDDQDIADKDIKTNSYNVYPQYDYLQTTCLPGVSCRGGEQVLSGYEVSQSVSVKIRDLDQVGVVLGGLGEMNVQNIHGPNFEIDDLDKIQAEAREEAIKEAKDKARTLAKDLGVSLVRVVGFWESSDRYGYPMYEASFDGAYAKGGSATPEIPVGESEITARVNITYEIR
tara:strand:+ start:9126 stop:9929 length:804 start_codon:yes stop_codon:yes gene_type:complete